jgi:hypothetical protein
MEAYGAVAFKGRTLEELVRKLGLAISDYGKNTANATTGAYITDLSTAQASLALLQNDMQIRLSDCIDRLASINAFFDPAALVIQQTTQTPRLIDDPTDNFIALAILEDARGHGMPSVFYTEDKMQNSFAGISSVFAGASVKLVHDYKTFTTHLAAVGFNYAVT